MSDSRLAPEPQLCLRLRSFSRSEPTDAWESLRTSARAADLAGVDQVLVSDHVVMGDDLDDYGDPHRGGQTGGRQPTGPDGHWLDPMAVIAHLSAITARVRFGTNILLAALRRPVVLAGLCSSVDVLSGGRLELGVGVGWQQKEYEAAGLPFAERGRILDETLEICRALWTDDVAEHHGDVADFEGIHQQPKPRQQGGVPIWIGGTVNPRSMRRLARFGCGWLPWGDDARNLADSVPRMRATVAAHDTDPERIGVAANLAIVADAEHAIDIDATMAPVPELCSLGVTRFHLGMALPADVDGAVASLEPIVRGFRAHASVTPTSATRTWPKPEADRRTDDA